MKLHTVVNKANIAVIVTASLAVGIVLVAISASAISSLTPATVYITADTVDIGNKAISLERRTDTSRTFLTDIEQRIVGIALSHPDVLKVLQREGDLYIERISQGQDSEIADCESACARLLIAWEEPAAALDVIVDVKEGRVKHWLFS